MKQVRIGDVPLEWFTGVGDVRSHDKACNNMTRSEAMTVVPKEKRNIEREIILALRKERKDKKRLEKLGIDYGIKAMGRGVSTKDILNPSPITKKEKA